MEITPSFMFPLDRLIRLSRDIKRILEFFQEFTGSWNAMSMIVMTESCSASYIMWIWGRKYNDHNLIQGFRVILLGTF